MSRTIGIRVAKLRHPLIAVIAVMYCSSIGVGGVHAQQPEPAAKRARTEMIAEFDSDVVVKKINVSSGVSVKRTSDNGLEVRITPFSEHGNKWPRIVFGPDFFGEPINLANHSRLETVFHHQSGGMSPVDVQVGTSPDGSRGVDVTELLVPGNTAMPIKLPIDFIRNNDPSEIALLQIVFQPREIETVYRIEPIRAVYDPATGSPGDDLVKAASAIQDQFDAIKRQSAADTSPKQRSAAQATISALSQRVAELTKDVAAARARQFYKAHRSLSGRVQELVGEVGKLRFMSAGPLWVWEPDRYPNIVRQTGPELHAEPLKEMRLAMAGNEFRDIVVMVGAAQQDLSLNIALRPTGGTSLPSTAVQIRQTDYLKNRRGEETGDALLPIEGRVQLPAGESRQLWIRFDTRTSKTPPGRYTFELTISDEEKQVQQVFPGELTVWNFNLPSYDILPNNSYAIFLPGSNFGAGEPYGKAIRHMKLYGLNYVYVEHKELPRPTGIDDQLRITGYDDSAFRDRVAGAIEAWRQAPGDERLNFIFSLSTFEELGVTRPGYKFPNEQWKQVFAQWLRHLKSLVAELGLKDDQWMLVLRDESGEPALMQVEVPLAEIIKSIDPSIRIMCNTSTVLSDTHWSMRLFKAFDVFQPQLGHGLALEWLKLSDKPLWTYQCESDKPAMGRDLYDYYRVYAWDMLDQGFVGTGVWTYYSAAHDRPSWNEDVQGCQLIYMHPQRGIVHSRRYEIFREGADDYRYVAALRRAAAARSAEAVTKAESLIQDAINDIIANRLDRRRCEAWRVRIAENILALQ